MSQYESTPTFYELPRSSPLAEFLLLLRAQKVDDTVTWWTAGTAFLIADRMAITAAHVFHEFERLGDQERVIRRNRTHYLPPTLGEAWMVEADPYTLAFDALQFLPDGRRCRWAIDSIHFEGRSEFDEFDSDLAVIFLKPHPACSLAAEYVLGRVPRLQLLPPAVGQPIFLCGWPDNPDDSDGSSSNPLREDDFFFVSHDVVTKLCTTEESREGVDYPNFRSGVRCHSGMSGGPVFLLNLNGVPTICGSHKSGAHEQNIGRHSILWPLVGMTIDHPSEGRSRVLDLIEDRVIDAPCVRHFGMRKSGSFTQILCDAPELLESGIFWGRSDCITPGAAIAAVVATTLPDSAAIARACSFWTFSLA